MNDLNDYKPQIAFFCSFLKNNFAFTLTWQKTLTFYPFKI